MGVGFVVGFANPEAFSINPDTGTRDDHTLKITVQDVFDGVLTYVTRGNAEHAHQILFTPQQIEGIQTGGPGTITAETEPPVGRPEEHRHTVTVTTCGIPGN